MVGRSKAWRTHILWTSILALALLSAVVQTAQAQPCAPEPLPGPDAPQPIGKFRLIAQLCPEVAHLGQQNRVLPLDLYDSAPVVDLLPSSALPPTAVPRGVSVDVAGAPRMARPVGSGEQRILALVPALNAAARANGLDPLLLHAVAHVESRHNPQAVSPAGARGVMQVMPATAQGLGVADPLRALHDPGTNFQAAAAYLRKLQQRYQGNLSLMLAAYNAGEGAVAKYRNQVPPYPETQNYVKSVLAIYQRLKAEFGGASLVAVGTAP
ncbi:soluble lytic murein transglycosylase-like protein [Burkholderiales bacterium JOSHI_001]|nr:soluble lytic murein transglycosylase-like protein [Burkholderiales bacterium JOSHI_001]